MTTAVTRPRAADYSDSGNRAEDIRPQTKRIPPSSSTTMYFVMNNVFFFDAYIF